ncbi:hypothetical protein BKA62DRAFT_446608 [Auriculariales sp. MPI-PUGE-AT-0066]|nr:hypothetical protein BKA62DRAFT_446608 [Auriculariales sp. MPI-PUGE-AT-0066]
MPATPAQALTNLLTALSQIFGDVLAACGGVVSAFVRLFWTLVGAVVGTGRAIATAAVDIAQDTVGFIWGNLVLVAVLAIGYYVWTNRQPSNKGRTKRRS